MFVATLSHPCGVLPSGNSFLYSENSILLSVRKQGLGNYLEVLMDENLIEILSYLTYSELTICSSLSRAMYVFSNHFELWRDIMLRYWNGKNINYQSSWKYTFIDSLLTSRYHHNNHDHDRYGHDHPRNLSNINNRDTNPGIETDKNLDSNNKSWVKKQSYPIHKPIKINGIFSNLLYRSWACSTFDYGSSCPGFMKNFDITVINHPTKELSIEQFYHTYEVGNIPVILKGIALSWPAIEKWSKEYLIEKCGNHMKFRATSATAPLGAEFTMEQYFQYAEQVIEEAPLYLFERDFMKKDDHHNHFAEDWSIPSYFTPEYTNSITSSEFQLHTDLFRVFGSIRRPDFRWLVIGPKRSGSLFHIDPNGTHAWNACIKGRKKWIFYPPHNPPPGVISSADGADVIVPISTGEWLLSFWKFHMKQRNHSDISKRPLEGITYPGDIIFVPHGYWHMVVNLDDCIALTQNYVSTSNLSTCLHFLREKIDQISGVRDREGIAIKPEEMYDEFIEKLKDILPHDVLSKAISTSYQLGTQQFHDSRYQQANFNYNRLKHGIHEKKRQDHDNDDNDSSNNNDNDDENDNNNHKHIKLSTVDKSWEFGFTFE